MFITLRKCASGKVIGSVVVVVVVVVHKEMSDLNICVP